MALDLPGVNLLSTDTRDLVFAMDGRILEVPILGCRYTSVFDPICTMDDRMIKVYDVGRQCESLVTNFSWVGGRKTCYDLVVSDTEPCVVLMVDDDSWLVDTPDVMRSFTSNIVELAACTGAMAIGPMFVGARPMASLDVNPLACEHLRLNQHGVVHQLDLLDLASTRRLHQSLGSVLLVSLFGFPCQPHSSQGSQLGQSDPRAKVFWAGLRSIFLLQSQACILECVPGASSDQDIWQGLRSLADTMHWCISDVILKLEHQWPMHRRRWWVVMYPKAWGHRPLIEWPCHPSHPTVEHVFPHWGLWDAQVEDELALSVEEYADFMNPAYGKDNRVLMAHQKCQTVLHSYANTHCACPCGCRDSGFSRNSLALHGLRGMFVKSLRTGQPRYLHPHELAALLTIPFSMQHLCPVRSALCLLGQVAAPLQCLWAYLHLLSCASTCFPSLKFLDPVEVLARYKREIITQLHVGFPFGRPLPMRDFVLFRHDGAPFHLLSCGSYTIGQLLQADSITLHWGQVASVTSTSGTRLPLTEPLSLEGGELVVVVNQKNQVLTKPVGLLMIALVHGTEYFVSIAAPGTFLFQLLWEHDLPTTLLFICDAGKLYGPDTRLWCSQRLESLCNDRFPTLLPPGTLAVVPPLVPHETAAGGSLNGRGLDAFAVWKAMVDLQETVPCCLLHPETVRECMGRGFWPNPMDFVGSLSSNLICVPFQIYQHWGLVVGEVQGAGVRWIYFDGLNHVAAGVALTLCQVVSKVLSMDFLGLECHCQFSQHHEFTCGTILVLHMAFALGLRGCITAEDELALHLKLSCRNHKTSWLSLTPGRSMDSDEFEAFGGAASHEIGLNDKSMWYAMTTVVHHVEQAVLVPPFLRQDSAFVCAQLKGAEWAHQRLGCGRPFFAFVARNQHWLLLQGMYHTVDGAVDWTVFDGLPHLQSSSMQMDLESLCRSLSHGLGFPCGGIAYRCVVSQVHPFTCGTVAVFHLGLALGYRLDSQPDDVWTLHMDLLASQRNGEFQAFGEGDMVTDKLITLLTDKGVPEAVVASRVSKIVQKLGKGELLNALTARNPWASLKSLASRPGNGIQLVHKEELEAFIAAKARDKHGTAISIKKKEKAKASSKSSPVWTLDAKLLQLVDGHFVDPDGTAVPQIDISQVTADSKGIAICSTQEAKPYLQQQNSISTDALALLTLEEIPPPERGLAKLTCLRYPVVFQPTQDPLLIQGCLVQLGDVQVQRGSHKDPAISMDVSATQVIKLQIFRDELEMDWSNFCGSPLKHLFHMVPLFRLCNQISCDHKCGLFHAAVEDAMDQVVHESWGRKFHTLDNKSVRPETAVTFTIYLRIASPATDELLHICHPGVYMEPRSETRQTDPAYSVIWIPGATRDLALHKLKLLTHGISLARMKTRFGIRVLTTYEAAAHAELRPGADFVKVAVKMVFRLHPLPHGLQRAQLVKLLKEWKWAAKPLQPARGTSDGGAWEVGSSDSPPCNILSAFARDVLVTLVKDRSEPVSAPTIVGPRRVMKHPQNQLASGKSGAIDPWTSASEDPWARYANTTAAPAPGAQKRLESFAAQLKTDIVEQVQDQLAECSSQMKTVPPSVDDQTLTRMQQLEVGVSELKAQGQQFRSWFDETGARLAAQDAQLQQVNQTLQQQQQDLQSVRAEVHHSADNLQQSVASSITAMQSQFTDLMASQLQSQMDRFETLLKDGPDSHKKQRT